MTLRNINCLRLIIDKKILLFLQALILCLLLFPQWLQLCGFGGGQTQPQVVRTEANELPLGGGREECPEGGRIHEQLRASQPDRLRSTRCDLGRAVSHGSRQRSVGTDASLPGT